MKKCGATIDASDRPCVLAQDHDLAADVSGLRHDNGAGTTWASMRRQLLNAASPALANALLAFRAHHPKCVSTPAREGRCDVCRDADAALHSAGRLP